MFKSACKIVKYWALITWRKWHESQIVQYEEVVMDLDLVMEGGETLSSRENVWVRRLCRLTCGKNFLN